MKSKIRKHFQRADNVLYRALERIGEPEITKTRVPKEYFPALCREIIAQQLSGRVGDVIFERFKKLLLGGRITPRTVSTLAKEDLRSTGMSNAKADFIKDLAEKVKLGELNLKKLADLEDEEVITELTKVKGIGRWTAEMFLMFCLGREDVFSHGDQGLKSAIKKLYNLKNPTHEEVETIVCKWSPYRTYACRILWKTIDGDKTQ